MISLANFDLQITTVRLLYISIVYKMATANSASFVQTRASRVEFGIYG